MMKLIAYDFDGTIYDGDSSVDFYKFCFKKKKSICKYWLKQLWFFGFYLLDLKTKTQMKEVLFCFLKEFQNPEELVKEFWESHESHLKKWYIQKDHSNDLIISASPEWLLQIPCQKLGVTKLIGSIVDIKTGKFLSLNCHGEEKVRRLKRQYPTTVITEMYTDSHVDFPMIEIAQKGFKVKKEEIIPYQEYKESTFEKIKHTFFTPKFIRFVFVGCINTLNGVLFSFLYSLVIQNATLAFVVGYITSLSISYLLNSFITFHDKHLTLKKFVQFCISYIPNFIVQLVCVYVVIDVFHWYKLIAYVIAAIIGIPITYLALLLFPFKEKKNKK